MTGRASQDSSSRESRAFAGSGTPIGATESHNQVPDDQELLDRMMADLRVCDELYKPTNYWAHYERFLLPELKTKGLRDFRRRNDSILRSFGATDPIINARIEVRARFRGAWRLQTLLNGVFDRIPLLALDVAATRSFDPAWVVPYFYEQVKKKYEAVGWDLRTTPTTIYGNPEESCEIAGGAWSRSHLAVCAMLADAAKYIQFRRDIVICELGPGMGRNAEVLARLFDEATVLLFDIPPQLYVANQYLTWVFGSRVVPYDEAVRLLPGSSLPEAVRGRIVLLPSWRLPAWANTPIDVFWNSASFQEMEPAVIINYLRLVVAMQPRQIYINAMPGGNYWGPWRAGAGGTKERVLDTHYAEALGSAYSLRAMYDTDYLLTQKPCVYRSYIYDRV